jgi:CheY-like chemotaxis protein
MIILYVDDDPDDIEIFCELAKEINPSMDVLTANDGYQALDLLNQPRPKLPDIVVLDNNMPRLTGFETLHELRKDEKLRSLKVVIYSTGIRPEIQKHCNDLKILCLNKGSTVEQTRAAIRRIIQPEPRSGTYA